MYKISNTESHHFTSNTSAHQSLAICCIWQYTQQKRKDKEVHFQPHCEILLYKQTKSLFGKWGEMYFVEVVQNTHCQFEWYEEKDICTGY